MGAAVGTHLAFAPSRATAGLVQEAGGPASADHVQESLYRVWERLVELREDGYKLTAVRRSQERLGQLDFARLHGFVFLRFRCPGATMQAEDAAEFARLDWGQDGARFLGPQPREETLYSEGSQKRDLKWAALGLLASAWGCSVAAYVVIDNYLNPSSDPQHAWHTWPLSDTRGRCLKDDQGLAVVGSAAICAMIVPVGALGTWGMGRAARKLHGSAGTKARFAAAVLFLSLCEGGWFTLLTHFLLHASNCFTYTSFTAGASLVMVLLPATCFCRRCSRWYWRISIVTTWWTLLAALLLEQSYFHKSGWSKAFSWIQIAVTFLLGFAAFSASVRENVSLRRESADYRAVVNEATAVQRLAEYTQMLLVSSREYHLRNFNCWHFTSEVVAILTDGDADSMHQSSELALQSPHSRQISLPGSDAESDVVSSLRGTISTSHQPQQCGNLIGGRSSTISTSDTVVLSHAGTLDTGAERLCTSWSDGVGMESRRASRLPSTAATLSYSSLDSRINPERFSSTV